LVVAPQSVSGLASVTHAPFWSTNQWPAGVRMEGCNWAIRLTMAPGRLHQSTRFSPTLAVPLQYKCRRADLPPARCWTTGRLSAGVQVTMVNWAMGPSPPRPRSPSTLAFPRGQVFRRSRWVRITLVPCWKTARHTAGGRMEMRNWLAIVGQIWVNALIRPIQ
jgi:hypothetical protein